MYLEVVASPGTCACVRRVRRASVALSRAIVMRREGSGSGSLFGSSAGGGPLWREGSGEGRGGERGGEGGGKRGEERGDEVAV